jgi:hypothetical protein
VHKITDTVRDELADVYAPRTTAGAEATVFDATSQV